MMFGSKFLPSDEDLLDILRVKKLGEKMKMEAVVNVDGENFWINPSVLTGQYERAEHHGVYYFFTQRKRTTEDVGRSTGNGKWKRKGTPMKVTRNGSDEYIGDVSHFKFKYLRGAARIDEKEWELYEYTSPLNIEETMRLYDTVICKLKFKQPNRKQRKKKPPAAGPSSGRKTMAAKKEAPQFGDEEGLQIGDEK